MLLHGDQLLCRFQQTKEDLDNDIQGWDFSADVFAALPFLVLFLAFAFDGWIETRFENQRFSGVAQETRRRAVQDWMQQYRLAVENGDERRAREVRRILRRRFGINV